MFYYYLIPIVACMLIFLLGISIGHSLVILKLRKEENKKRELELMLLDKKTKLLKESKKISDNLEELLFKANVQQEIENLLKKRDSN